jgi:hypothetical protein
MATQENRIVRCIGEVFHGAIYGDQRNPRILISLIGVFFVGIILVNGNLDVLSILVEFESRWYS